MGMPSRRSLLTAATLLSLLSVASAAAAQTPSADNTQPPRLQVGVTGGLFVILPMGGVNFSLPVDPRIAIEGTAEWIPVVPFDEDRSSYLLFQLQARQAWKASPTHRWHVTYGVSLFGRYKHQREFRQTRPDGSVLVYPEYRELRVQRPLALQGGIGGERPISNRLAMRWDLQALLPVTNPIPFPRVSVGVAWQPGGRR